MPANLPPPLAHHDRQRWIVAELDARAEIDTYAALCLRNALDAGDRAATPTVWVDLRDLLALGASALDVLVQANADCRARGSELAVLLGGHPLHDRVAEHLAAAGLRYGRAIAGDRDGDGDRARCEPHAVASVRPARPAPFTA